MAGQTLIEWAEATWNIITGCTRVSRGCGGADGGGCYAERLAATRLRHHPSRAGLTDRHGRWNGTVRFNAGWLDQPLRWSRPRRIFVCAHGDLFHEAVPAEWIDQVFGVMLLARQHTFQVLTKRPRRMREYFEGLRADDPCLDGVGRLHSACAPRFGTDRQWEEAMDAGWPLPNAWLGTSVEDQDTANERIPVLLETPAAVRWISAEPLLGPSRSSTWTGPSTPATAWIPGCTGSSPAGSPGRAPGQWIRAGRARCVTSAKLRACRSSSSSGAGRRRRPGTRRPHLGRDAGRSGGSAVRRPRNECGIRPFPRRGRRRDLPGPVLHVALRQLRRRAEGIPAPRAAQERLQALPEPPLSRRAVPLPGRDRPPRGGPAQPGIPRALARQRLGGVVGQRAATEIAGPLGVK